MIIDCAYLYNQWRGRGVHFSRGIERCNIIIRVVFANGAGPRKGDLFSVDLVNGVDGRDRVPLPNASVSSVRGGEDIVYTNVPLARHGFLRVSVFSEVRSPAMLGMPGGGGRFLGSARMNSMFLRDMGGATAAPRMNGARTLVFNLREESAVQSPSSSTYTGPQSSVSVNTGAQPWGVGSSVTGTDTNPYTSDTMQAAPRVYGTGRWILEQVR